MNKRTAIVILNWNGEAMLRHYLPSVLAHSTDEAEVIVADNASTDGSLTLLREEFPTVRIIAMDHNRGFAGGYNMALMLLDKENKTAGIEPPEYYLLLNSDVRVEQGWLTPMRQYMDDHPDVAAAAPKLLSDKQPNHFEYAGAAGGFIDRYGYPYCRGRIFDTVEKDTGQYDTVTDVHWATGACLLIRRTDYWAVGGLDERFFAHNEEIDLCWRLRLTGRRIVCVPQSTAFHLGGGTLPKGNPRKTYLNFRNNLTMLYKNLPEEELKKVMRRRTLLDYVAAMQMLLLGHSWGDFRAIMKARRDFKAWKSDFYPNHRWATEQMQKHQGSQPLPYTTPKSILAEYYMKGHKTYMACSL